MENLGVLENFNMSMSNPERRSQPNHEADPAASQPAKEAKQQEQRVEQNPPSVSQTSAHEKKKGKKRPGIFHRKIDDAVGGFFGMKSRWQKEMDHIDSLSDEDIKKEADAEREKANISTQQHTADLQRASQKKQAPPKQTTQMPAAGAAPAPTATPEPSRQQQPAGQTEQVPASSPTSSEAHPAPPSNEEQKPEQKEQKGTEPTYEVFNSKPSAHVYSPEGSIFNKTFDTDDEHSPEKMFEKADIIAIGDMHANALKFLEQAMQAGLITMPKEKAIEFFDTYKKMIALAQNPKLPPMEQIVENGEFIGMGHPSDEAWQTYKEQYPFFPFATEQEKNDFATLHHTAEQLIDSISLTPRGQEKKLVLIGDLISDRGVSDTLVLHLLKKIREKNQPVVMASNHDMEPFFRAFKYGYSPEAKQRASFYRARVVDMDRLNKELREHYKGMTLFYYDKEKKLFFSHAPITKELMAELKESCEYTGALDTPEEMTTFVEKANAWFANIISDSVDETFHLTPESRGKQFHLLREIVWNREGLMQKEEVPFPQNVVKGYIHGHDSDSKSGQLRPEDGQKQKDSPDPVVYNLDNTHRKQETPTSLSRPDAAGPTTFFTA